jgi:hypothetical protein
MSRPVTIETTPNGKHYLVRYAVRTPRQRHLAAQFNGEQHTLEKVTAWVEANPKLHLSPVYSEPYRISEDYRAFLDDNHGGGIIVELRRKPEDAPLYWGTVYVVPLVRGGYREHKWLPLGKPTLVFRNADHALREMAEFFDADYDLNGVSFLKATEFI